MENGCQTDERAGIQRDKMRNGGKVVVILFVRVLCAHVCMCVRESVCRGSEGEEE